MSSTGRATPPNRGERDCCRLHHGARMPGRRLGRPPLRLPSSLRLGVEVIRMQPTAGHVEPAHTHLVPAYPVRHGQGGTHSRVAHDSQDRTPHTDEDPFSQGARRCCAETACCKHLFHVFQMFQQSVASASYECCKSISGCSTCCNGCARMLQAPILNVSSVFLRRILQVCLSKCCICFYTYDVSVSSGCCICLQRFQVFFRCFCKCFRHRFQMLDLFSDVCCNCYILMFQN
jgi:hypothetical protein